MPDLWRKIRQLLNPDDRDLLDENNEQNEGPSTPEVRVVVRRPNSLPSEAIAALVKSGQAVVVNFGVPVDTAQRLVDYYAEPPMP